MGYKIHYRQLEAFRAVIMTGSMTKAGNMLGVTQPAITRLIREMEVSLSMNLFDRRGNKITPTSEGQALYREVERHFERLKDIESAAELIRNKKSGSFRIAAIPGLAFGYLPNVVADFLSDRPKVSLTIHADTSRNIRDLVADSRFDIGVVAMPIEETGLSVHRLPTMQAFCVLPKGHRLSRKRSVAVEDLDGQNLHYLDPSSLLRKRIEQRLAQASVKPRQWIEATFGSAVLPLVRRGIGLAVVDPFTAYGLNAGALRVRPFEPPIPYEAAIITSAQNKSNLVGELIHVLKAEIERDLLPAG